MKKFFALVITLLVMTFCVNAQNLLYEGFDSGTLPTGWTIIDNDGDGHNWQIKTGSWNVFSGAGCIASASYDDDSYLALTPDNWLITPAINLTSDANLIFHVVGQDPSYVSENYTVYISTTGATVADFDSVLITGTATASYETKTVDLSAYTGQTVYIAFRHHNTSDMFWLNLDEVSVFATPTTPTIDVTPLSFDFGTTLLGDTATGTLAVVGYSLTGSITATAADPFLVSADGVNFDYTATLPQDGGTLYIAYVPSTEGEETGTVTLSATGATSVTVDLTGEGLDCSNITLPFTESFESVDALSCWTFLRNNTSNGFSIVNVASAGEKSLRFSSYSYVSSGDYNQYAITPKLPTDVAKMVSFDYMSYSSSYTESFKVGYSTADTISLSDFTWGPIVYVNNYTSWLTYLNATIPDSAQYIAINYCPAGSYYYLYVDNFSVTEVSDCMAPVSVAASNITHNSASINWSPIGTETAWSVVVVEQGEDPDMGTAEYTTVRPFTVQGLMPDTLYDVYVRAECESGNSAWSTVASFRTTPDCSNPSNPSVSAVTGTSAVISWTAAPYGVTDYIVEYGIAESGSTEQITVEDALTVTLTGLTQQSDYEFTITSVCNSETITPVPVEGTFTTGCLVGTYFNIGTGTETSSFFPSYSTYNYSYTQQIFQASEFSGQTPLYSVAFEMANVSVQRDLQIYLMHTTATDASSWIPASTATLVYSGSQTMTEGWNTYTFSAPFQYNGTDNLALIIIDMTGSWTSGNSAMVHEGSANSSKYTYNDGNPYSIASAPTTTAGSTSNNRLNVKFGGACDESTCASPVITNVEYTSDEATITWEPGYQETAWVLKYKTASATTWTEEGSVTSPYTLEELAPNTPYEINLYADCGSEELSAPAVTSFTTECSTYSLPFTENFDNIEAASGVLPGCWERGTETTSYPYVYGYDSYSPDNNLYFYVYSGHSATAILPELDEDIEMDSLFVSFYCKTYDVNVPVQLGYLTNLADPESFVVVAEEYCTNAQQWERIEMYSRNFAGTTHRLALRVPTGNYVSVYIDNLSINYIPACTHVENITVSDLTSNSANISWTAGGEETEWDVVYGVQGQVSFDEPTAVFEPSFALTGLSANTPYEIYVRANCGGDVSEWEMLSFRTDCEVVSTLPFTENFDSYTVTNYQDYIIPYCWDRIEFEQYGETYPCIYNSSTYAHSGTNSIKFNSSTPSFLMLPTLDSSIAINNLQLSLFGYCYSNADIIVGIMEGSTADSFVPIDTLASTPQTQVEYFVLFNNYSGTGHQIAFKYANTSYNYFYIDDITLDIAPNCEAPDSLTVDTVMAHEAVISWTSDASITSWQVVTALVGTNPDFSNPTVITTNPYTLDELTQYTQYNVYLRNVCPNGTSYSNWISTSFMTTGDNPANLPYFTDFTDPEENVEWALVNGAVPNKWHIGTAVGASKNTLFVSKDDSTHLYNTSSYSTVWAFRDVIFPAAAEYTISFNWRGKGEGFNDYPYDYIKVYVGAPVPVEASEDAPVTPTGATVLSNVDGRQVFNNAVLWQHYSGTLNASHEGLQRIYFCWRNDGSSGSAPAGEIDSISITASNCGRPYDLTATTVHPFDATLEFSAATEDDTQWEYVIGTGSYNPDEETPISITSTTFNVTSLEALTGYTVYVRTVCGPGEYSAWSNPVSFTTLVACPKPTAVTVSAITTTSATIAWTENGTADTWNIEYGPAGFNPGEGTLVTVTTNPYTLTGLTASTSYSVHIQADCGIYETSLWAIANFATECESFNTFPYTEGFENDGSMPTCWSQEFVSGANNWTFTNGSTSGVTSAHTGSFNATFKGSSHGPETRLISPVFDLTGINNPYLTYWHAQPVWYNDQDTLGVYYRTSSSSEWVYLTSYTSSITTWTFDSLALPNPSATYQVAFLGHMEYGYGVLIDDITIDGAGGPTPPTPGDTCLTPTALAASNVTYNSASINWTAGGDETAWNLQYKKAADADWSSSIAVTARPYALNGLDAETAYQVRVQANCGEGETSEWSAVADFTTTAVPAEPCDAPTGLTVSNITTTTALVTWTAGGTETAWNVQYKLSMASEWNNAPVSAPTYTIGGLLPGSEYTVQVQANCGEGNVSGWVSTTFTTQGTGISNVELANSINIMPNPAENYIELTINSNVNVKEAAIYNAFGQLIQKVALNDNHARIDVSEMAAGMYFVRIANDNTMATKKFIKK